MNRSSVVFPDPFRPAWPAGAMAKAAEAQAFAAPEVEGDLLQSPELGRAQGAGAERDEG